MLPELSREHSGLRHGVFTVGSITADVTAFSARPPGRGETILGDDSTLLLGGKGANQAVAVARAGAYSSIAGCVGSDIFRSLTLDGLLADGVDIADVRVVEGATGIAHIRVDASGANDIVSIPLANSHIDESQVDAAIHRLAGRVSVLLVQLEIPWRVAMHAIRAGSAAGLTVILDPAPAAALDDDVWRFVDVVTPNETEASQLTHIQVTDEESAIAAGRWFCKRGAGTAIITLAAAGAVLVTATGVVRFPAYHVQAVDTTAAGDAFAGYLSAAIAVGVDIVDAVPRAMAAGALTVTKRGASPSLPTRAEVELFLAMQSQSTPSKGQK